MGSRLSRLGIYPDPPSGLMDAFNFYIRKYRNIFYANRKEVKEIKDVLRKREYLHRDQRDGAVDELLLERQKALEFEMRLLEFQMDWFQNLHITWAWDTTLLAVPCESACVQDQSRNHEIRNVVDKLQVIDRKFCSDMNGRLQRTSSLGNIACSSNNAY